ncbi:MAG: hypothetical protein ACPHUK_07270 [Candidatus Poseidoniaceae archaeon]
MEILGVSGMSTAVNHHIYKNDKYAIDHMVEKQIQKTVSKLTALEVDDIDSINEALATLKQGQSKKAEEKEILEILNNSICC